MLNNIFAYIFLFLIGYQVYFIYYLFSYSITTPSLSLAVSVLGIFLAITVIYRKHNYKKHIQTMAVSVNILSVSAIMTYLFIIF
ncbi:hypothetical protein QA612_00510 [Evansella sp. AB-P1]|uniref:hypothetical protein n=1 Tax=Evansella sp. AB-P1 TaxID=3037653 RepID=UPI00241E6544|nr:hypothetical protein [Evansella sp. AB-P1]MDG5785952.1 hypothetical protein [Evansella sp. AB-P1]